MTDKMRSWAENFVAGEKAKTQSTASYFGVTTKALSSKIVNQNRDATIIKVSTSRRDSTSTELNAKVYFQDIEISLLKENDLWKVDRAEWK
jgi:hypothetical protein